MDGEYIRDRMQASKGYEYAAAIGIIKAIIKDNRCWKTDAEKVYNIKCVLDVLETKEGENK
jgi:hypothetical protein